MIAWIAFVLSTVGIVLNAKKNIWCWPVWLLSNVFWMTHTLEVGDAPAFITWCVFAGFNVYGFVTWYRSAHGQRAPWESDVLQEHIKMKGKKKYTVRLVSTLDGYTVSLLCKRRFRRTKVNAESTTMNYSTASITYWRWVKNVDGYSDFTGRSGYVGIPYTGVSGFSGSSGYSGTSGWSGVEHEQ